MRHLTGGDPEAAGLELALVVGAEAPVAAQPGGPDREVRRRHRAPQQLVGGHPLLGQQEPHGGVVAVAGTEERQPVGVVPVEVGQHHRALEGPPADEGAEPPQAGAGVEDQVGVAAVADGQARRLPAVSDGPRAGARRGAPGAADGDAHRPLARGGRVGRCRWSSAAEHRPTLRMRDRAGGGSVAAVTDVTHAEPRMLPGNLLRRAPVAQSDRASVYETEGHRFESCLAHARKPRKTGLFWRSA